MDFAVKRGQCTDFDEYCQGPIDTSKKDLFKHEVDENNWILVESFDSMDYEDYVYEYATGKNAAEGKMTKLKPGQSTPELFIGEKLRVINLVEDKFADAHGCATVTNKKFDIPVAVLSIQTTDLLNTDGTNDEGLTDPFSVYEIIGGQLYQQMKTDGLSYAEKHSDVTLYEIKENSTPDWFKPFL